MSLLFERPMIPFDVVVDDASDDRTEQFTHHWRVVNVSFTRFRIFADTTIFRLTVVATVEPVDMMGIPISDEGKSFVFDFYVCR